MKSNDNFINKFANAIKRRNEGNQIDESKIPSIREMLENITKISDESWGRYGFRREPLKGKFNDEARLDLIKKSNECGKICAEKTRSQYGNISVYKIAEKMGLTVEYPDRPNGGSHIIFAQFVEPKSITIYKDSVNKAIDLIEKENLSDLFNNVNVEEILLAHEIFHFIEENDDSLFTKSEKIRLWKIGPIKNDSGIVCLGEIAGMAYAKELLKLNYSPYILDVFLVYLYNIQAGYMLYQEIMSIDTSSNKTTDN